MQMYLQHQLCLFTIAFDHLKSRVVYESALFAVCACSTRDQGETRKCARDLSGAGGGVSATVAIHSIYFCLTGGRSLKKMWLGMFAGASLPGEQRGEKTNGGSQNMFFCVFKKIDFSKTGLF